MRTQPKAGLRGWRGRIGALVVLLLALMVASARGGDWSHEDAIEDVLQRQAEAWNRGDLEGFMEGYLKGPELVFTSGSQVRRGWQVTYEKYKQRYGTSPATMGTLRFSDLEVHPLGEDSAWVLGRWDLSGSSGEAGGIFTLVMQRVDDLWLVVHDHTSSDPKD